jgi:hypothetical protein
MTADFATSRLAPSKRDLDQPTLENLRCLSQEVKKGAQRLLGAGKQQQQPAMEVQSPQDPPCEEIKASTQQAHNSFNYCPRSSAERAVVTEALDLRRCCRS